MVAYSETLNGNYVIRTFNKDVHDDELVWHRDINHRFVEIIECNDWKLQFDNQVPKKLKVGKKIFIPAMKYHRIIKGSTDLVVRIQELGCP